MAASSPDATTAIVIALDSTTPDLMVLATPW